MRITAFRCREPAHSGICLLLSRDNWDAVELMDNWCFVYDRMPRQMRRVIDLKISGISNKSIAKRIGCSLTSVYNHLLKAKKRLLRGENIL